MNINEVKIMVDKADTIRKQIQSKNHEMEAALTELARVQKKIASLGQDIEILRVYLEEVENELRPTLADYLKVPIKSYPQNLRLCPVRKSPASPTPGRPNITRTPKVTTPIPVARENE